MTLRNIFCLARTIYRGLINYCILLLSYPDFADINRYQICPYLIERRKLFAILQGSWRGMKIYQWVGSYIDWWRIKVSHKPDQQSISKSKKRASDMLIWNQERSGKYFSTRANTSKELSISMFTYFRS